MPNPYYGLTPVVTSTGAANSLVVATGQATALDVYATNFTATSGFLIGYNATAVPADGALDPTLVIDCAVLPASGTVRISDQPGPGTNYSHGIVYFLSSNPSGYTKTSGVITGFIRAKYE